MQHLTGPFDVVRPFDIESALTRSAIVAAAFAVAAASAAAPMAALGATTAAASPRVLTYAQTIELDDADSATARTDVVRVVEDGGRTNATIVSASGAAQPVDAVADQATQCYRLVASLAPVAARLAAGEPTPPGRLDVAVDGRSTPVALELASEPLGGGFSRLVARSAAGGAAGVAGAIDETNGLVVGASFRIAARRRDGSDRVATCRMQLLPDAAAAPTAHAPAFASVGA